MSNTDFQENSIAGQTNVTTLNIILVTEEDAQAAQIKEELKISMDIPWNLSHCAHLKEVKPRINKADVLVLDAGKRGDAHAKRLFEAVQGLNDEIPIICLVGEGKEEDELAVAVMEKGASDVMIRGTFGRLTDAIEYAIIRQAIIIREKRKKDRQYSTLERTDKAAINAVKDEAEVEQNRQESLLNMFLGGYSVEK